MLKNTNKITRHSELVSESNRHCEQSEAISSRLPRATALAMTEQTGRSMVEMLGVLAVIGVLSITGISGYTTAMNKHKANEILDAASKRAVAVSTQIQRGNTSPTLDEFDTNTVQGVKFEDPATVGTDAKQFRLPLDWSDITDQKESLCQYMQQYISEDGTNSTALIDSDCARILYNSDLSVGVSNTNNRNSDGTACADGYAGTDCDSCASGFGKHEGACEECPTGSGTTSTYSGSDVPNYTGCKCGANQTWENSQCKSAQKEFYITSSPTNHYGAASACSSLTVDGGGWQLATLSEFFDGIGGKSKCSYNSWNDVDDEGNDYSSCNFRNLTLFSGSQSVSDAEFFWFKECWEEDNGGQGTSCRSDSDYAWAASYYGVVDDYGIRKFFRDSVSNNDDGYDHNFYALCVR